MMLYEILFIHILVWTPVLCLDDVTVDLLTPIAEYGEACGYQSCPAIRPNYLNVHIVPATHGELGGARNFYQHYTAEGIDIRGADINMKNILDAVITSLWTNKQRTHTLSDLPYFFHWWKDRDATVRRMVYELVRQGRLYFVGGGWGMSDESAAHYHAIIDHYTYGLRKLNATFLECARPLVTWQADTFGHSREFASLMAQMGYDGHFISPISYDDELARMRSKSLEFMWRGSDDLGPESDIFTHKLFDGYWSPPGFCFGIHCTDPLIVTSDSQFTNLDERVQDFGKLMQVRQGPYYTTNNVLVVMGQRMGYYDSHTWYANIDKLIRFVNEAKPKQGLRLRLFYSTPACYLQEVQKAQPVLRTKQDDFFPMAYDKNTFVTAQYFSRASFKYHARELHLLLFIAKQLQMFGRLQNNDILFEDIQWMAGAILDHTILTGAMQTVVTKYYRVKIHKAKQLCLAIIKQALNKFRGTPSTTSYYLCPFNVSSCWTTSHNRSYLVIYNPLAWRVTMPVRVPVQRRKFNLYDNRGDRVQHSIMSISNLVKYIPDRSQPSHSPSLEHEMVFLADQLPPMGYRSYYLEIADTGEDRPKREIIKKLPKNKKRKYLTLQKGSGQGANDVVNEYDEEIYLDGVTHRPPIIEFANVSKGNEDPIEDYDYILTPRARVDLNGPTEAPRDPMEARHDLIEARDDPIEARRDNLEARHDPIEARHDPIESQRDNIEARRDNIEARRDNIEARHDPIEARRDNIEARRDNIEARRDNIEARHDPIEARRDNIEARRDNIEARRDNTEARRDNIEARRDNIEARHDPIEARRDNIEAPGYPAEAPRYHGGYRQRMPGFDLPPFNNTSEFLLPSRRIYPSRTTTSTTEPPTPSRTPYDYTHDTTEAWNTPETTTISYAYNTSSTEEPTEPPTETITRTSAKPQDLSLIPGTTRTPAVTLTPEYEDDEPSHNATNEEQNYDEVSWAEELALRKLEREGYLSVESLDDFIRNDYIKINLDRSQNKVKNIVLSNGVLMDLDINMLYYVSDDPVKMGTDKKRPGAQIFRPMDPRPEYITKNPTSIVLKTEIVEEVQIQYSSYGAISLSLYKNLPYVELDWLVGPIPIQDELGKEVFVRYSTDLANNGVFYTDSNARQTIKRIKDTRATYTPVTNDNVSGNFYPVTSKVYIEDLDNDIRFSVFPDRGEGCASLNQGQLDILLHRRILTDDTGLNGIVNETAYGKGLIMRGKHRLYLSKADYKPNKFFEKKFAKELELQPKVFASSHPFYEPGISYGSWSECNNEYTALNAKVPIGVHVLSFEKWNHQILIRLENYLENNDVVRSGNKKVNILGLFKNYIITSCKETMLAANIYKSNHYKMEWRKDKFVKNFNAVYGNSSNLEFTDDKTKTDEPLDLTAGIELVPQQIRTFICSYEVSGTFS